MALSDSRFLIANHFQNSVDAAVTIQRPTWVKISNHWNHWTCCTHTHTDGFMSFVKSSGFGLQWDLTRFLRIMIPIAQANRIQSWRMSAVMSIQSPSTSEGTKPSKRRWSSIAMHWSRWLVMKRPQLQWPASCDRTNCHDLSCNTKWCDFLHYLHSSSSIRPCSK